MRLPLDYNVQPPSHGSGSPSYSQVCPSCGERIRQGVYPKVGIMGQRSERAADFLYPFLTSPLPGHRTLGWWPHPSEPVSHSVRGGDDTRWSSKGSCPCRKAQAKGHEKQNRLRKQVNILPQSKMRGSQSCCHFLIISQALRHSPLPLSVTGSLGSRSPKSQRGRKVSGATARGEGWVLGIPGFVAPLPSFSQEPLMESSCVPGTVLNRRAPALPSQSPQSPGKGKGQSEQSCDRRWLGHWSPEERPDPGWSGTEPVVCPAGVPSSSP